MTGLSNISIIVMEKHSNKVKKKQKHCKRRPDTFKLLMERGDGANKTFRRERLFVFVCFPTLCRKLVQIKSNSFH